MIRTYTELIKIDTFIERFNYLKLDGTVGKEIFGFDRYINQNLYHSSDWQSIRNEIIVRDNGCDLGIDGRQIFGRIYVHHMNPISLQDITEISDYLFNPEYLITTSLETHNAIHYGGVQNLSQDPIERKKNDTCLWAKTI